MFGYIHPNRRLESLLQALAELPTEQRRCFHLDVYGELWDSELIGRRMWSLAIEDIVQVHGFVPEAELDAALERAHLAINLRYPTMGEASGSQLRIWDHALPSLVTQVGMYACLPADTVAFVRPDHEIEDLQLHLRALLSNPNDFRARGLASKRWLEARHTPETYVDALFGFARRLGSVGSTALAHQLSLQMARHLRPWVESPADGTLVGRVATEIQALTMARARGDPPAGRMAGTDDRPDHAGHRPTYPATTNS